MLPIFQQKIKSKFDLPISLRITIKAIVLLEKWKCLSRDVVEPSINAVKALKKIFMKQNTIKNFLGDANLKADKNNC